MHGSEDDFDGPPPPGGSCGAGGSAGASVAGPVSAEPAPIGGGEAAGVAAGFLAPQAASAITRTTRLPDQLRADMPRCYFFFASKSPNVPSLALGCVLTASATSVAVPSFDCASESESRRLS